MGKPIIIEYGQNRSDQWPVLSVLWPMEGVSVQWGGYLLNTLHNGKWPPPLPHFSPKKDIQYVTILGFLILENTHLI